MNMQLNSIAAKLKAWRLTVGSQDQRVLAQDIHKAMFSGDFYRDIWDEPVLLGLQDFITQRPPNQEMYGAKLGFIKERTASVIAINDLFAAVLFHTTEQLSGMLGRISEQLKAGQALVVLQANGRLSEIRNSNAQPHEKLAALVEELSRQVPSLSAALNACFEAVKLRQEAGAVTGLLVTKQERIGMVLQIRTLLRPGSGVVKPGVETEETFRSAVCRAREALHSRGCVGANQDIIFTVEKTDATYSGSSIALPAAMAIYSSGREWQFDPYTAFTGDIDIRDKHWNIVRVEGIPEKLDAARSAGIRRIVLPRQNNSDVPAACQGLELVFVDGITEVLSKLVLPQDSLPTDTVQQRKVFLVNTHCSAKGWQVSAAREIQSGVQFTVTPATADELTISIYDSGSHTPKQHQRPEFQDLRRCPDFR